MFERVFKINVKDSSDIYYEEEWNDLKCNVNRQTSKYIFDIYNTSDGFIYWRTKWLIDKGVIMSVDERLLF